MKCRIPSGLPSLTSICTCGLPYLLHTALQAAATGKLPHIVSCLQEAPGEPDRPQVQSRALPSQEARVRGAAGYLTPVSHPPLGPGAAEALADRPSSRMGNPRCVLWHESKLPMTCAAVQIALAVSSLAGAAEAPVQHAEVHALASLLTGLCCSTNCCTAMMPVHVLSCQQTGLTMNLQGLYKDLSLQGSCGDCSVDACRFIATAIHMLCFTVLLLLGLIKVQDNRLREGLLWYCAGGRSARPGI